MKIPHIITVVKSRIRQKFQDLESRGESALVSYIMAGFPDEKATISTIQGLIKGGADIIEIGLAFSDPLADGPTIQNAANTSLYKGSTIQKFWNTIRTIRKQTDIPLIVMTYTNIVYHFGYSEFIKKARNAGIDGIILADMSIEESKEYLQASKDKIDTIFLVSPNTKNSRLEQIAKSSTGFLYLVAVYGTTGVKTEIKQYTIHAISNIKKQTKGKIPLGVGFGVSTPQDVKKYVTAGADAVIVGSAFLKLVEKTPQADIEDTVAAFTKKLKRQTRK